jgi:hypothetical protein
VEGTIAQSVRTCEMRRARYIGSKKLRLQALFTATAMNVLQACQWIVEGRHASTIHWQASPSWLLPLNKRQPPSLQQFANTILMGLYPITHLRAKNPSDFLLSMQISVFTPLVHSATLSE